jgi:hypothetical protein
MFTARCHIVDWCNRLGELWSWPPLSSSFTEEVTTITTWNFPIEPHILSTKNHWRFQPTLLLMWSLSQHIFLSQININCYVNIVSSKCYRYLLFPVHILNSYFLQFFNFSPCTSIMYPHPELSFWKIFFPEQCVRYLTHC